MWLPVQKAGTIELAKRTSACIKKQQLLSPATSALMLRK
jgi:hypothetical protein